MNISRRLATGVASWLSFEYSCNRGNLFCEQYLSQAIAQILSSQYGGRVVAEHDHPILHKQFEGRGKRPKIDFCVLDNGDELTLALEAKWVGNTMPKIEDIVWDLIRLEMLAAEYKCEAFFLLAGRNREIQKLFNSKAFLEKRSNGKSSPILKNGERKSGGIRLDVPPSTNRIKMFNKVLSKYPEIEMPTKLSSGGATFFPKECRNIDYQVYVWKVGTATPRRTFFAKEHKWYS